MGNIPPPNIDVSVFFAPTSGFKSMKSKKVRIKEIYEADPSRDQGAPTNRLRVAGPNAYLNEML